MAAREKPRALDMDDARQTHAIDARAIQALRARGERFTVPGFCREWLKASAVSRPVETELDRLLHD